MLAKKALLSKSTDLCKHRRLLLASRFSSKAGDGAPNVTLDERPKPLLRQTRNYSSGGSAPPGSQAPAAAPGTDYLSLFQPATAGGLAPFSPGSVLKIYPLPRYVLKEDIVHHLEGVNVKPENVKFVYTPHFRPDYAQFNVESTSAQKSIMRRLQERGRLGYRILRAEMSQPMPWTVVDAALKDSPRGRTLLMYNASINTDYEDVERFFSGYNFDPSYIRFIRVTPNENQNRNVRRPISLHVAVGFTTKLEALRAMREKMGDFCSNVAINLRLIQ
ncbi:hypothetical protein GOP47_0010563 [Adiantum capillus-veneris]|uniref:Uncharacterized protein n=1 Tax=Adiantum capillus-veneris TaxID=13818 RepID=A0A9D4ZHW7_ADICA|nr:hypothetical protein GOP47_0010563 [Adiantum capillus-veneris]